MTEIKGAQIDRTLSHPPKNMAAALKAKGYDYRFTFARGATHCDARVIAQTLPDALEWTWKGYPR